MARPFLRDLTGKKKARGVNLLSWYKNASPCLTTRAFYPMPQSAYAYVSNDEGDENEGGAGSIVFDENGGVISYERLLNGTTRNCGGGKTP